MRQALIERWVALVDAEGSTRAIGLMRLVFPLLIWARWADELQPFRGTGPAWWLLSVCFFGSTTAMFLGVWSQFATAVTAGTLLWMYVGWGWLGGHEPWTHHHTWLLVVSCVWLAFTPCGRSFSLDRWWAVRRAEVAGGDPPLEHGGLWAVNLLAVQASAVYFWSAYDKSHWGFLTGERLQAILMAFTTGSDPVPFPGFAALCAVASVITVALEYLLAVGLFVRPWQRWLFPIGLVFHGILYVSIPVGTFSLTMAVLYLAYADPQAVHRAVETLTRSPRSRNRA